MTQLFVKNIELRSVIPSIFYLQRYTKITMFPFEIIREITNFDRKIAMIDDFQKTP